jgi:hypothetical protein
LPKEAHLRTSTHKDGGSAWRRNNSRSRRYRRLGPCSFEASNQRPARQRVLAPVRSRARGKARSCGSASKPSWRSIVNRRAGAVKIPLWDYVAGVVLATSNPASAKSTGHTAATCPLMARLQGGMSAYGTKRTYRDAWYFVSFWREADNSRRLSINRERSWYRSRLRLLSTALR